MRVIVIGASGNVGTSLLEALAEEQRVHEVIGVARRIPTLPFPKVAWMQADITESDLSSLFEGADVVVHLAWAIQPSHDEALQERINVGGTKRVLEAVAAARVPALVYASSVGAYSAGPKQHQVDESWPTGGISGSVYSRHKATVERELDAFERRTPETRVVRLRPGLIFKAESASEIRRLFLGPLMPNFLARPSLIPFVPRTERLRFQAVHAGDVAQGYRQAIVREVSGAFNIAAAPDLGPPELAMLLGAREVPVQGRVLRRLAEISWKAHLQPADPGWIDLALGVPLMDSTRAAEELGWVPRVTSLEALSELLRGLRQGTGMETPPLDPKAGGPGRIREFATGVGQRQ